MKIFNATTLVTKTDRGRVFNGILLLAVAFAFFMVAAMEAQLSTDYNLHTRIARAISADAILHPVHFLKNVSYPLWHFLTRIAMGVFGCSGRLAAAVVSGGCAASVFLCAVVCLSRKHRAEGFNVVLAASVLLMLAAPIYLCFFNRNLYLGQGSPNIWHNPTFLMVKAVAFPVLVGFSSLMSSMLAGIGNAEEGMAGVPWLRVAALALGLLATNLAKPCFMQVFFPAFCLLALFLVVKHGKRAVRPVCCLSLVLLPSVLFMGLQYILVFDGNSDSKVAVAFLKYWRHTTPNAGISFILVSLFPLLMLVHSVKHRRFGAGDALVWLMFVAGVLQKAVLIEEGRRMWHGNLTWGFMLAIFFVWYFAIDKFISLSRDCAGPRQRAWLVAASAALSMHVASGMWYIWRLLIFKIHL